MYNAKQPWNWWRIENQLTGNVLIGKDSKTNVNQYVIQPINGHVNKFLSNIVY